MEKTYTLNQREAGALQQIDQERTNALAMIGALSLDMKQAEKNLETAAERQRSFIRQALDSRGVERYENARAQNGSLIVTVPDPVETHEPEIKPNGPMPAKRSVITQSAKE